MSNNRFQQARKTAQIRSLYAVAIVLGCLFGMVASAAAQASFPITPDIITPPPGNSAYLEGHAVGSQGYICLPTASGTNSWTVNAARPEATLFVEVFGHPVQIITHFTSTDTNPNDFAPKPVPLAGNATWQSSLDTSKVWAVATGKIEAGTDASCPHKRAIPCLLLQSIGNQEGPTGGSILAKTTFVQRLNTRGGAAPATACRVGQTQLQSYTADYVFFRADE